MPSTDLDLANAALSLLGEEPLSAFTDDRKAARVIQPRLAPVRDAILRSHPWNCAASRAALAQLAAAPAFGFTYAYALPTDYLRLLAFNNHADPFQIERHGEKRALLTDSSSAELLYIARVTNPAEWDPLLFETIAAGLALNAAPSLLDSDPDIFDRVQLTFLQRMQLARSIDGQENPPVELFDDDFLGARLGSGAFRAIGDPI